MAEGPGEQRVVLALAQAQEQGHELSFCLSVAVQRRGQGQLVAVSTGQEGRREYGRLLARLAIVILFLQSNNQSNSLQKPLFTARGGHCISRSTHCVIVDLPDELRAVELLKRVDLVGQHEYLVLLFVNNLAQQAHLLLL